MIKVYELTRYDGLIFSTVYLGVNVTIEFKGGDYKHRATYTTNDIFKQDALEHDKRFGRLYKLVNKYEDSKAAKVREAVKAGAPKKVTKVKTVNQALSYLRELNIEVTEDATIQELCEKNNIEFPNLKY